MKIAYKLKKQIITIIALFPFLSIMAQNNLIPSTQDCSGSRPPFAFNIQQRWSTTTGNKVWTCTTPLAGDIDGDGRVEIFALTSDNCITVFEGETGVQIGAICPGVVLANWAWTGNSFCLLDGDRNGKGEVFISAQTGNNYLYEVSSAPGVRPITFTQRWVTAGVSGNKSPIVVDLDGDGVPEFVAGNRIYDYSGNLKETLAYYGVGPHGGSVSKPLAMDFDNDGIPEVVVGTNVYKYNGTTAVLWRTAPNIANQEGSNMIADINQDGIVDIVFHPSAGYSPSGPVKVWTPLTNQDLGNLPVTLTGQCSTPFVGDIDGVVTNGKKYPEILVNTAGSLRAFSYNGTNFVQKWSMSHTDMSGGTILTLFDFNNDGVVELIYRDETLIHIFDGSGVSPVSMYTQPCGSETATELPIVVDALGTGSANIVVTGSTTPRGGYGEVMLFEGGASKWMSCPKVWNQHFYSNLLVNDDLTIPDTIKPVNLMYVQDCQGHVGDTVQFYNGGPMQAPYISEETYCPIDISSDVYIINGSITISSSILVSISITVGNQGLAVAPSTTPIRYYQNDMTSGNILSLANTTLGVDLYPGQTTTITQTISVSTMPTKFYVRLLDDGVTFPATGAFSDCNLTNNTKSFGTFELFKTANSLSSCIDGTTNFTVGVVNNSDQLQHPTTYSNIIITDSLGTGWEFISATPMQGNVTSYNPLTYKLVWSIPTLQPQDTALLYITAKAQSAGAIRNMSWVDSVGGAFIGREAIEAYVIVSTWHAPDSAVISPTNPIVCGGGSVVLTATGAIGATSYQWYRNNVEISGATSSTYSASTAGNYTVSYFNDTCVSKMSKSVTVTVGSTLTHSVSISSSANNVCSGVNVTFTATATNGGATYQWKKNGSVISGATASTYTYAPANNDIITCETTTSNACASPSTATSTGITMNITPSVVPAVTITVSPN